MRGIVLAAGMVLLAACGQGAEQGRERGEIGPGDLTPEEREAFVYSAVIAHMTSENGSATYPVVFVLDRAVEGTGDPSAPPGESSPISPMVQARVREELALKGPIRFVADQQDATRDDAAQTVKRDGILITLGPVPGGKDTVEVEASSYAGALASTWHTWSLERRGLRWQVTGEVGPTIDS